jgi:hypothetical protein
MDFPGSAVPARLLVEGVVRQHPAYGSVMSRIELVGNRLCHGSTRVKSTPAQSLLI